MANDSYFQSYANFNDGKKVKDKKECVHFYPYRKGGSRYDGSR